MWRGNPISGGYPGVHGNVWLGWTWGLFSLEPFIPHVNDSKLRAVGSRAWALDAAVVPRPLFSSGRLYKSVRQPWHVLIQRCSTVVQSPSSPDSIGVFGIEKKITAKFTICDLVSFPVNIGCLFYVAELKNWRSWSWQDITPAKGMYHWYLGSDLLLLLDFQVCVTSSEKHLSIKPAVNLGVVRPTRYPGHVRSMAVSDCSKRGNMKAGQESFSSSTWVRKSWATEHETTMETSSHSRSN